MERVADAAELGEWIEQWIEWQATRLTKDELTEYSRVRGAEAGKRRQRYRPDQLPLGVDSWISHLAHLEQLASAGLVFGVDDLRPEEWRGRAAYRAARERFWNRYRPCPGCEKAILKIAGGHDLCGWKEEK